jgi:ABC-type transport system substrate-binding protein/class 3 adenylate cyclase
MSVPAGERRVVSVLVADAVGSTQIGEKLGPERSKFLFDEVVRLMREEVERFGGTVAQLTGDGLLALFGAPNAHDDDSERAVRAALAIREAGVAYGREVNEAYGIELAMRVAVNTGLVVVPDRDDPPEQLYNALGDTVNVAARLQELGEIVVGPDTARQLEEGFELEPLGEVELKGKSVSVAAFTVAGERAAPAETALSPLVGRDDELGRLREVFEDVMDGRGAIVVLIGEPGIGKSRLKTEARERFIGRIRFLEGHAASYTDEIPYWPVRELLRDWLALAVSDPEARARLELRTELSGLLGDEADEAYPFLAGLLGLPLEESMAERLRDLSRDSVRQQTFDAVQRLARALAEAQPLCFVLEDLHWADEATLALAENLLEVTEDEPVVLLFSFRTEGEHGAWDLAELARRRFRHRVVQVELEPLEAAAAQELAAGAAEADLPDEVRALLAERSGGNPFFLEEALRDLLERGVLRRLDGGYELTESFDAVSVPAAVQEALQARLDRLEPGTREVAGVAAVVGRTFGLPLLERVLSPEELRPALSELQRLDLVVEERRQPAREYRFRHGLVQEVAYSRLVEARRRELHGVVAEALEQLHSESLEEVYGLLGRHYSEADEPARAADYLLKAGDAARSSYANEEALALYRRALAFLERTGDEERARETLLKVALTHHMAFDFERANDAYEQAFSLPPPEEPALEPTEPLRTMALVEEVIPGLAYDWTRTDTCRLLFRGLVQITRELDVVPDVAERWTVSPDGHSYRFVLRSDARWSDGEPVSAHDFAFTIRQMPRDVDERLVPLGHLLADVEAVALDDTTLELRLSRPHNYLLYELGQPTPFFPWPRHVYERLGLGWHESVPLIGNGPFVLTERDSQSLVLTASPTWRGRRGNVSEVHIEQWDGSPERVRQRWSEGALDALFTFFDPGTDSVSMRAKGMNTVYLGLHSGQAPCDHVQVRLAIGHAIDKRALVEQSDLPTAHAPALGGFVPPAISGHSHRLALPFDPGRSRALLAEGGYHGEELVLMAPSGLSLSAHELARQLRTVDLRIRVEEHLPAELDHLIAERAHLWVWGYVGDWPDPSSFLEVLPANFPWIYQDERLKALLAEARASTDQDRRLELYREYERIWIAEQAAVVPLAYNDQIAWHRPWVEGLWLNPIRSSTFAEVVVKRPDSSPG